MFKNKRYYAEKIMNMEEADRKHLFVDMLAHRKQHLRDWDNSINSVVNKNTVIWAMFDEYVANEV